MASLKQAEDLISGLLDSFDINVVEYLEVCQDRKHDKVDDGMIIIPLDLELHDEESNTSASLLDIDSNTFDTQSIPPPDGHVYDDLLPLEIYSESEDDYLSADIEYEILGYTPPPHVSPVYPAHKSKEVSETIISSSSSSSASLNFNFLPMNAMIITGPSIIDIGNGNKALIMYPFPCQVVHEYDDAHLGVKLAYPYNNVDQKLAKILIKFDAFEVQEAEDKYMKRMKCDLGYQSMQEINDKFQ